MGIELSRPITVKVDNTQVISFVGSTCADSKLRGMIDNRENWVRELKDENNVKVEYVQSNCNYADILSKCLLGTEFNKLTCMIMHGYKKRSQVKSSDELFMKLGQEKSRRVKSKHLQSQDSGGQSN